MMLTYISYILMIQLVLAAFKPPLRWDSLSETDLSMHCSQTVETPSLPVEMSSTE